MDELVYNSLQGLYTNESAILTLEQLAHTRSLKKLGAWYEWEYIQASLNEKGIKTISIY
jgi:hypothetical protein